MQHGPRKVAEILSSLDPLGTAQHLIELAVLFRKLGQAEREAAVCRVMGMMFDDRGGSHLAEAALAAIFDDLDEETLARVIRTVLARAGGAPAADG